MYNGLSWPDEDFSKVTMERDLQIRRSFKNSPILWHVLAYIASYKPAVYSASVLLRAICASLLHQWRAKSGKLDDYIIDCVFFYFTTLFIWRNTCKSLLFDKLSTKIFVFLVFLHQQDEKQSELGMITVKFLQIMAMGQLLPPPLDYLHVIIRHFEPHEVALIMKECVWNYVKENMPSPSTLISDNKSMTTSFSFIRYIK